MMFCGIIIHKGDGAMSNTSKLSDITAKKIKSMIENEHRFSVGDKLPNENDFAAELGISSSAPVTSCQEKTPSRIGWVSAVPPCVKR